jgi:3,4-dihydroxy 2-butanone 4-phosphate synthase/GTP cyclohydrolase II
MITNRIQLNTIEEAIEDIRQGKIIIVDDEDRETKVIFGSSRKSNPEMINFMATHGRGLICAPLTESR